MSTLDSLSGTVLDEKYRVERRLGVGGMGAVFAATHLGTDRLVALKVITPRFAADAAFVERFRREARAAGRLRHPNIVDVTDFGFATAGGERLAYLVMEYLDGCSLADVLEEDPALPLEWVVDFFDQLALAVDEAHRHGVVHRDLKPSNVWLEPNRRGGFTVKVLDFGLAKLAERPAVVVPLAPAPADLAATLAAGRPAVDVRDAPRDGEEVVTLALPVAPAAAAAGLVAAAEMVTDVGAVMGTPRYMSPEQCMAVPAGPPSDIYSLGTMVYEMLAGTTPFDGGTAELLLKHVNEAPEPLSRRAPGVPSSVGAIVMSALAKDPADRPASATSFAAALRAEAEPWWGLFRRAAVLCSAHYTTFLRVSVVACLPYFFAQALQVANRGLATLSPEADIAASLAGLPLFGLTIVTGFLEAVVSKGVAALVLAQLLLAPLRTPRVRLAASTLRRRVGRISGGALLAFAAIAGPLLAGVVAVGFAAYFGGAAFRVDVSLGGADVDVRPVERFGTLTAVLLCATSAVAAVWLLRFAFRKWLDYQLFPVVLLAEDLGVRDGLARSRRLSLRSRREVLAVAIASLVPILVASLLTAAAFGAFGLESDSFAAKTVDLLASAPILLLADPFVSVLSGLLYIKLREADGESTEDVLDAQFVDEEPPRSRWQRRLSPSGFASGASARGSSDRAAAPKTPTAE